jgi:hypothetical protein
LRDGKRAKCFAVNNASQSATWRRESAACRHTITNPLLQNVEWNGTSPRRSPDATLESMAAQRWSKIEDQSMKNQRLKWPSGARAAILPGN